ncbi:MAG: dTDP-4-amino-4,6-dideoxygalactose transaminase [Azospirillaceae bacterium]|nr:dTDP-4-amino-4,6-dideoxygalactose transaminase [Azospirillaceae bacterium]
MIPFNRPFLSGREIEYIRQAHQLGQLAGNGKFTSECQHWLEHKTGCIKSLLTHSCTAALEMCAILAGIAPGDEVIMPSFTFVSTANAFVLRGGVPVFVDIRPDTLNLDEARIEAAITPRTRAIVAVHYAGVSCDMDAIMDIARRHDLLVIEDAAQGLMSTHKGRALGSIGHLGTLSFHETKNVISGEGGALLINSADFVERAEIIWEKGTNRSRFFRGDVDKYNWIDVGSSYLPGEITAAFLLAQLEQAEPLTAKRQHCWQLYHDLLEPLEAAGVLRRPVVPGDCGHNAHLYYVLLAPLFSRRAVLKQLDDHGITAVFHYVPLHSSPAGRRFARSHGTLATTDDLSERLVRLPLWIGLEEQQQRFVVKVLGEALHVL